MRPLELKAGLPILVSIADTIMRSTQDKARLADEALDDAQGLAAQTG